MFPETINKICRYHSVYYNHHREQNTLNHRKQDPLTKRNPTPETENKKGKQNLI